MNRYISYKNRGMLLEELINKTINHYNSKQIAYFSKNHLNIKFTKHNDLISNAFIKSKSTVDYYGIYKGKYITFEAKSTDSNNLGFANIKRHQHEHLQLINKLGGLAFYIIFFKRKSLLFKLNVDKVDLDRKKKSLSIDEIRKNGERLNVIFPGIIDFLELI